MKAKYRTAERRVSPIVKMITRRDLEMHAGTKGMKRGMGPKGKR